MNGYKSFSIACVQRLPSYLNYLKNKQKEGVEYISTVTMANDLNLAAITVKKDLQQVSSTEGKPNVGFCVARLIKDIESFLGFDNTKDAVLVGAGSLGSVLLSYNGFQKYGLNIVAAFDIDPEKIDTEIHGKRVFDLNRMTGLVKRMAIHIGIITVPKDCAQSICDMMVEAGIRAIWNFAPVSLTVPNDVVVLNEDLASSLAVLSKKLKEMLM
ncbi:MAG TPA: redox-sensing transcriptional repressor Rex [Clostridia bacterium]